MAVPFLLAVLIPLLSACASTIDPTLAERWTFHDPDQLSVPESVVIDHEEQVLYVSNGIEGAGRISKMSVEGEMLEAEWLGGLYEPLGLAIADGKLYISDYGYLHVVILSERDGDSYEPGTDPCIVGDVAIDAGGNAHTVVYYRGRTSLCTFDGQEFLEIFELSQMESPNGILAQDGRLIICGARQVASCNPDGSDWQTIYDNPDIEQFDGIHPDGAGGYFLTSFLGGEIVHLYADGTDEILATFESPMDLDVDLEARRLYVPAKRNEEGIVMGLELSQQRARIK
jgi:hypothetical protein